LFSSRLFIDFYRKGSRLISKVLVTGVGGPAGRAATRFLREKGIHVLGTDIQRADTVVDSFHLVPRGDDPGFNDAILDLIVHERPALVIPTVSEELSKMSSIRNRIRALGVHVFISEPAVVDLANDKLKTVMMLRALGIPVPRTVSVLEASAATCAGNHLGYPFLAKPRVGRGGRGVVVYQQPSDAMLEQRTDVVFQEFMPGEECDINLFAYPAGHVKAMVILQKTRMRQGIVGNALSVQRVIRRDMAELGIRATRALGLEGPIDMDVRRDCDGVARILEINARVGANVSAAIEIMESLLMTASEGNQLQERPS
jgi:carbamoyl-phosphate synthase large subunit